MMAKNSSRKRIGQPCACPGCDRVAEKRGLCGAHYQRWAKQGECFDRSPISYKTPAGEPFAWLQRVAESETDECIPWPFAKTDSGYGHLRIGSAMYLAHRLSLQLAVGPPPKDKPLALHAPGICHNKLCCNPRHLSWGNSSENMRHREIDGTSSRADQCGKSAKLDPQLVQSIRHRIKRGDSVSSIARVYSVDWSTIASIRDNKSWSWVE